MNLSKLVFTDTPRASQPGRISLLVKAGLGGFKDQLWVSPDGSQYKAGYSHMSWLASNPDVWGLTDTDGAIAKALSASTNSHGDFVSNDAQDEMLRHGWVRVVNSGINGDFKSLSLMKSLVREYYMPEDRERTLVADFRGDPNQFVGSAMRFMAIQGPESLVTAKLVYADLNDAGTTKPESWKKVDEQGADNPQDATANEMKDPDALKVKYVPIRRGRKPEKPSPGWDGGLGRKEISSETFYTGPDEVVDSQHQKSASPRDYTYAPGGIGGKLVFNADVADDIREEQLKRREGKKAQVDLDKVSPKTKDLLNRRKNAPKAEPPVADGEPAKDSPVPDVVKDVAKPEPAKEVTEEKPKKKEKKQGKAMTEAEEFLLSGVSGYFTQVLQKAGSALKSGKTLAEAQEIARDAMVANQNIMEAADTDVSKKGMQYLGTKLVQGMAKSMGEDANKYGHDISKVVDYLLGQWKKTETSTPPVDNKGTVTTPAAPAEDKAEDEEDDGEETGTEEEKKAKREKKSRNKVDQQAFPKPEIPNDMTAIEKMFAPITAWTGDVFFADPSRISEKVKAVLEKVPNSNKVKPKPKYFEWQYVDDKLAAEESKSQKEKYGITMPDQPRIWIKRLKPWADVQEEFKKSQVAPYLPKEEEPATAQPAGEAQ